jgi:hypothetical protein
MHDHVRAAFAAQGVGTFGRGSERTAGTLTVPDVIAKNRMTADVVDSASWLLHSTPSGLGRQRRRST